MELILASIFSALIIVMTVFFLLKVFLIAYKRKEISKRKCFLYAAVTIVISFFLVAALPFVFQSILELVY
ncbi:hypothetical protein NQZ71_11030 [Niallia taxi]|uniref:hypothetical protein n=1 Tax=Niallia taxi TaxID=2499688 RepID=UPI002934DF18|nr:hypothetical protein [Niallia taxi]WOD61359.1 hypothetical protein NQZ71_11030 [Niallia taxi]